VVGKKQKRNINDSLLWNMRGMGQIGRIPALVSKIKESHADLLGSWRTKRRALALAS
jgi:predicted AAA+ superfamily ATPase